MIISASYKTDIPTFYGTWFMNRLRAGYCKMVNAWNRNQIIRVSLERHDVDGFVFWTKNLGPFLPHLQEVRDRGFPFSVQYTINSYPRTLEQAVVDSRRSVEHVRWLADEFGPRVCVWRYDTIVISSLTPVDFHLQNFERLCGELAGATDEVVISFVHLYKKTLQNMERAAKTLGFDWQDPPPERKRDLATRFVEIARAHGMQLSICAQRDYLVPGAADAHCIDAGRLEDIGGKPIRADLRGGRKECGCFASRDIGEYDTCPHGCVYCYAVLRRHLAQRRFREHDPESEFLFPQATQPSRESASVDPQLRLFDGPTPPFQS
jgi:hypothetical protein